MQSRSVHQGVRAARRPSVSVSGVTLLLLVTMVLSSPALGRGREVSSSDQRQRDSTPLRQVATTTVAARFTQQRRCELKPRQTSTQVLADRRASTAFLSAQIASGQQCWSFATWALAMHVSLPPPLV